MRNSLSGCWEKGILADADRLRQPENQSIQQKPLGIVIKRFQAA
ncbi:hypothetical protein [Kingella sp. (in: b-proteobacteria)]|nr:hypothetical protein [Kingella sp. (in: b-proteobacteria)]MDO4656778.1 hypothetical protein [Kingella sp. (in: b-proteobacteria)]